MDDKDIQVVQDIIDKKATKVWNVNYHDTNSDGIMDEELVETAWPISSIITTGSANTFMMLYLCDIVSEVKGASFGSGNDTYLFGDTFLKDAKSSDKGCVKLGTSSQSIEFENGKAGSTNVIAEQKVTCVLSDWNRSYLTNEKAFETAHIDVVRIAAASFDKEVYTHSISLLGFLFQKESRAAEIVNLYNETKDAIQKVVDKIPNNKVAKLAASSMNGYLSSEDSDYTAVGLYAGGEFALKGYDFGGSTSIKVADNLGVYKYEDWNYILHIRTSMNYKQVSSASQVDTIISDWASYTSAFKEWKNANSGQFFISGVIPVPLRVAYSAYAMYGDLEDVGATKAWADGLHQKYIAKYAADKKDFKAEDYFFVFNNKPLYTVKAYDGYYDGKAHDAVTLKAITEGCTFQYSTDGKTWSSEVPKVTEINTNNSSQSGTKIYYKVTCPGYDEVTSSVAAKVWHEKLAFTTTAYNGVSDGAEHDGMTITITDPALAAHFTLKYGKSSSSLSETMVKVKDVGETKVYWSITPDATYKALGYKTESGNVTAKVTAPAA